MNIKNLPLHKKIVGTDTDYIKITIERINNEIAIISTINPQMGQEVMRTQVHVETGQPALKDVDTNFGDLLYINGEKFDGYPFSLIH